MEPFDVIAQFEAVRPYLVFLVGLVLAAVQVAKQFGLGGKGALAFSLVLGVLFGAFYYVASFGLPTDVAGWFMLTVVAMAPGLGASGAYDLGKAAGRGFADRLNSR